VPRPAWNKICHERTYAALFRYIVMITGDASPANLAQQQRRFMLEITIIHHRWEGRHETFPAIVMVDGLNSLAVMMMITV
jgi:hypothetical protein